MGNKPPLEVVNDEPRLTETAGDVDYPGRLTGLIAQNGGVNHGK